MNGALTAARAGPRLPPLRHRAAALLAIPLAFSACASAGHAPGSSPHDTLLALQSAASRNDTTALYALLPERSRDSESLEHFRTRLQTEQTELGALRDDLSHAESEHRQAAVEVPLRGGNSVAVVEDREGWRLSEPGFGPASTPNAIDAARALRAALVAQSLPAILQILSARARGAIQAEISALTDALGDPAGLAHTSTSDAGQRMEIHLRDGRTLVMVREGANWRVDDVQ